jgi:hypothetical protein
MPQWYHPQIGRVRIRPKAAKESAFGCDGAGCKFAGVLNDFRSCLFIARMDGESLLSHAPAIQDSTALCTRQVDGKLPGQVH